MDTAAVDTAAAATRRRRRLHGGGGYRGGGYGRGGYGRGGYGGYGGYGRGGYGGWGWGGVGLGLGLGLGYPGYGYGGYWPGDYGYSTPYYYGDGGAFYDTTPYYYGSPSYDSGTPVYGDVSVRATVLREHPAQDNEAHVRVIVPPDAKVWFNNRLTKQTGTGAGVRVAALAGGS